MEEFQSGGVSLGRYGNNCASLSIYFLSNICLNLLIYDNLARCDEYFSQLNWIPSLMKMRSDKYLIG